MKKLSICLAIIISLIALPVYAGAPYISLKGSAGPTETGDIDILVEDAIVVLLDDENSDSIKSIGIAVGYAFDESRFEFEYYQRGSMNHNSSWTYNGVYFNNNLDTVIKTKTFFVNSYSDFEINKHFGLYTGFGIGFAKHKSNTNLYKFGIIEHSDGESNTEFAYNFQAGGTYIINKNIALDIGLRYANLGEPELWEYLDTDDMIVREIVLSLRYNF